eukprot:CAMPEP_0202685844 /NCGR_PEP_ID=MMETSP1385-20130828/1688_1 /ASSEMBLY_ACC=CAM_ASM_000861 /TAXON_ID=933848 /ORGANISM="Elphidium margaritaceum" /LENGTH=204 /DNA_ID=CAMNT_0049340303 /DNA_START=24 /DNA_END=638 /DNA_ORIENTATION=+
MKLISIAICRVDVDDSKEKDGDKSTILCQATNTSSMLIGKASYEEFARFVAREISARIELLAMKSLEYKGTICHAFRQQNGLCVCVLTDDKYPVRGAHSLVRSISREFESHFKDAQWQNAKDFEIKWSRLPVMLSTYQNPPKDKIEEIQTEVDNAKQVVVQSIEKVMNNMEKLDDLVEKSNDLSNTSRMFYKKSKKMNRCCVIL